MNRLLLPFSRWPKITRVLSLACLCLFLVVSCSASPSSNNTGNTNAGGGENRIVIGTTNKPRTLDPADAYETGSLGLIYNMSDRLYTYSVGKAEVSPQLATDFPKISADGLTYTIPLRENVVFHDGEKFNAQAMAFSLERFIKNGGKPAFLLGDIIDTAKATGEYELTIKLKQPFAAFPSLLAFAGACAVSPKAYKIGEGEFEPNNFVGTGPYKLTKFATDKVQIDPFDQYWGEKPINKGVVLQILSSGVNLFNSFKKQSIDVAALSMDADQIKNLRTQAKDGAWQAIANNGGVVYFMSVNRNQEPLNNPKVRQALASMFDRKLILDRVLYGQAQPLYSMVPTTFDVYKPVFKDKYGVDGNIETAKKLLQEAGFSKDKPAKIELWYRSNIASTTLNASVIRALAKKRMDGLLEIQTIGVDSTTAYRDIPKGAYPTTLLEWYPDFIDPDNYVQPFLACEKGTPEKGCEKGGSASQGSFFYSDRMNKLIEAQRKEQNQETRKQIFAEIQQILAEEVPYIPLWQGQDYLFAQNGVKGVQQDASQLLIYSGITKKA